MSKSTITYRGHEITARYEDDRWVVTKDGEYLADFPTTRSAAAWIDGKLDTIFYSDRNPWRTT